MSLKARLKFAVYNIFIIVGDIHGQFLDLIGIFDRLGYPNDTNYLFLGDYVDRGESSVETICLLLAFKLKYPKNFFLLRGNHETKGMNKKYGFMDQRRFFYNFSDT